MVITPISDWQSVKPTLHKANPWFYKSYVKVKPAYPGAMPWQEIDDLTGLSTEPVMSQTITTGTNTGVATIDPMTYDTLTIMNDNTVITLTDSSNVTITFDLTNTSSDNANLTE